jgi:glycosyltransferase involved in cell wall biosynthesis
MYQQLAQIAGISWKQLYHPIRWAAWLNRRNDQPARQLHSLETRGEETEKRLLIVQYAGDYRQAAQDFAAGKDETYYAQRHSVDSVASLTQYAKAVTVISCLTEEAYDQVLPNGVRAIGGGFKQQVSLPKLIELIAQQNPTHLIVRMAEPELFDWVIRHHVKAIALFASSLPRKGLKNKIRNALLVRYLNHPQIEWVGGYGITSSLLLKAAGVKANKIIPWDFLLEPTPGDLPSKTLTKDRDAGTLFYIGSMMESKGVGDVLEAVARLRAKNVAVNLKIAGRDQAGFFTDKAKQLGIAEFVEFLGMVPNKTVEPLMREADIVLVPSWHEYPEGFPLVIHHALRARTPIVASDHPMFRNNLKHEVSAMIFPAKNAAALSDCIEQLLANEELYTQISAAASPTWQQLRLPVKWADMLERWLNDTEENRQWLSNHQLSSGRY